MNLPRVYMCSPSWTPLPPSSPYHPSGSSQCTSPKHPVSCIEPRLAIRFLYDIIHVSMPFSQIIPPSPSPTESKRLFDTSVSLLLSRIQGYCYHLSKLVLTYSFSYLEPVCCNLSSSNCCFLTCIQISQETPKRFSKVSIEVSIHSWLEEELATHSNILAWGAPWTGDLWRAAVHGVAKVGHNLVTKQQQFILGYKHRIL